jgi:hypothetical protein
VASKTFRTDQKSHLSYESAALTAELQARKLILHDLVNLAAAQMVHKAG